jgi:hypothetical protein
MEPHNDAPTRSKRAVKQSAWLRGYVLVPDGASKRQRPVSPGIGEAHDRAAPPAAASAQLDPEPADEHSDDLHGPCNVGREGIRLMSTSHGLIILSNQPFLFSLRFPTFTQSLQYNTSSAHDKRVAAATAAAAQSFNMLLLVLASTYCEQL